MRTPEPETLPEAFIAQIEPLYHESQMMRIWERLQAFPPLLKWTGCRSLLWAGRLAAGLGSQRLCNLLHRRNYQRHPQVFEVAVFHAHTLLNERGPLVAREFLLRLTPPNNGAPPDIVQYYYTLRAAAEAEFRDFETAAEHLRLAEEYPADRPWLQVMQATILERKDRYEEALELVRAALQDNPNYRPAILTMAHLLQVLSREEEALELLRSALQRAPCSYFGSALLCLEMDLGLTQEAAATLELLKQISPLADRTMHLWWQRNRTTLVCRAGELEQARRHCAEVLKYCRQRDPWHRALADRLAQPEVPRRRRCLMVEFVRQHHKTCAPATLAALSQYWQHPVEHLDLAEAICYDGTPSHSQRQWAEGEGLLVREFTVTWESATALVDRGVPFAVTTTEVNSSHLQAVVGYDELRRSLLVRDPYYYYLGEARCPQFLQEYAAFGPRGLILLPPAEAHRLEGLSLPDTALYDQLHAIYGALEQHQRARAAEAFEALQGDADGHWITCLAGWALGAYDANPAASLHYVNLWLQQFPKNARLLRIKLDLMETLATRQERLAFMDHMLAAHPREPFFLARLAAELQADGRELPRARELIRRALAINPTDPDLLKILGDILWNEGQLGQAAEHYRLAACAATHNESHAETYFYALQFLRRTEEGLAFLRLRVEQLGRLSSAPARTLHKCLAALNRTQEGFAVLEAARQQRPEDGELLLYHADALARYGNVEAARSLLNQAQGKVRRSHWLRVAAQLAVYAANLAQALAYWQEVLQNEPLALDAHAHVYQLLAETRDPAAARAHLDEMCRRFPSHCGLLRLRAENTSQEPLEIAEPALRELLAANPVDTDTRRELAMRYAAAGRLDEALAEAERVVALAPLQSRSYSVRGAVLKLVGRSQEASADFAQALRLDVNNGHAMTSLVELATTDSERTAALDFIQAELVRQVVFEEALPAFRNAAHGLLPPEQVLSRLREALAARPDLWAAWSVVVTQLVNMHRLDEALQLSREACNQFPLVPRLWLGMAQVFWLRGDTPAAVEAAERALAINPRYAEAVHYLADILSKSGNLEKARQVLERGIAHSPLEAALHQALALVLLRSEQPEAAIERAKTALRLNPHLEDCWGLLQFVSSRLPDSQLAIHFARELTQQRAGDPQVWLMLADCLAEQRDEECLAAVERALALNPRNENALEAKARFLTTFNRCEEALAVCLEGPLQPPPLRLRLRAAWIEHERGCLDRAMERMESALAECPTHYGALQLLSLWQQEAGQLKQALATAERLIQVAPHDPVPLRMAAELHHKLNQKKEAVALMRRVMELDAQDQAAPKLAALLLTELAEESGDPAEAIQFVEQQYARDPNDVLLALQIRLLLQKGNPEAALGRFVTLCRMSDAEGDWGIFHALRYLVGRVSDWDLESAVDAALAPLKAPPSNAHNFTVHPHLGAVDIQLRFRRGYYTLPDYLSRVPKDTPFFRHALVFYFESVGDAYSNAQEHGWPFPWTLHRHVRQLSRQFPDVLAGDAELAEKYAAALAELGEYAALMAWCEAANRPENRSVEMCHLRLKALLACGQWEPARAVVAQTLNMRQNATQRFFSLTIAAIFHAWEGEWEQSRQLLAQVPADNPAMELQALRALAEAWLEWEARKGRGAWQMSRILARILGQGLKEHPLLWLSRPWRRLYRASCARWRRQGAEPWLALWQGWRELMWGWLFVLLLPITLPLLWLSGRNGRLWVRYFYWCWRL